MDKEYHYVVGTGGVGKGILFELIGPHTLGRNESRSARLTDCVDYCKLHIILNYVAAFLDKEIPVYAVSRVGDDEAGHELLRVMGDSGINTEFMAVSEDDRTLYSVCFSYPSGEGGNITAVNGANQAVSPTDIQKFFANHDIAGNGIVLAAPEVPIDSRIEILKFGKKYSCLNVASILPGEVGQFDNMGGFGLTDVLAINEDEANALIRFSGLNAGENQFKVCYEYLKKKNPDILLIITLGSRGSTTYYKNIIQHNHSFTVPVANTAGAGDCYLGTMIAAIAKGVPVVRTGEEKADIATAQDLSSVASAIKVGCNDTIDFSINKKSLLKFAEKNKLNFSKQIMESFFTALH